MRKEKKNLIAGADECTPSYAQYFSWINISSWENLMATYLQGFFTT